MSEFIHIFILLPLAGFVLSLLIPGRKEVLLSRTSFLTVGVQLFAATCFTALWIFKGFPVLEQRDVVILKTSNYEFLIDFAFDKIAATFLLVGAFLTFLVTIYSRYYLHREQGYKRFFNTILFFYIGYNV